MKKLRQKEQRLKDLKDEDVIVQLPEIADGATGIQSTEAISGPGLYEQKDPQNNQLLAPMPSEDNGFNGEDASCDSGHEMDAGVVCREQALPTVNHDRLENVPHNSTVSGSDVALKHPSPARHSCHRDPNASAVSNKSKTWAWKVRTDVEEQCPKAKLDVDGRHGMAPIAGENSRLLIGSISVAIEDGARKCLQGLQPSKDYTTPESYPVVKVTQPISHDENGCEDSNGGDATTVAENHSPCSVVTDESATSCCDAELAAGGGTVFSSKEAAFFLSQSKHLSYRLLHLHDR
jgi:hypothetical protein